MVDEALTALRQRLEDSEEEVRTAAKRLLEHWKD